MTAQKVAAVYLGVLFLAFLAAMVAVNGLTPVLVALSIVAVCVSVPVALIVLTDDPYP